VRAVLQRARRGRVSVDGQTVAEIGPGLVILLGIGRGDTVAEADGLAEKTCVLRIFEDDEGKMNRSLIDAGGAALVVSQFTLLADTVKGRRPSFLDAADPAVAEPLVRRYAERLRQAGVATQLGVFGAHMLVEIDNDGPVTILLEREPPPPPRSA
jgi:D-tyrosyl-tRNA(Tyr) deacylase